MLLYVFARDLLGQVYAQKGVYEETIAELEKAYTEHNCWLGFLNIEPRFHRLRPDTRFAALLKKVGLY